MRLVLFSGGDEEDNHSLNTSLMELVAKKNPLFTYIPSSSLHSERYFQDFVEEYKPFGVKRFIHFPVDRPIDPRLAQRVLQSDMIHLSGGNTFYFLKYLKESGWLKILSQYTRNGGVLTGVSAGSIMMTPNIATAEFPQSDRDDNLVNIRYKKAMGLVPFDFMPHYRNTKEFDRELLKHSRESKSPLYACRDGAGIIIQNNEMTFHGKCFAFSQGKKFQLRSS